MISVNIQEAQTHLSRYLDQVEQGEVIVLCCQDQPIAEIRALPPVPARHPVFGRFDGFGVPDSFFEPLDEPVLAAFNGTRNSLCCSSNSTI